jgi:hypothetical protein
MRHSPNLPVNIRLPYHVYAKEKKEEGKKGKKRGKRKEFRIF